MNKELARKFDRDRDFKSYFIGDTVGATYWILIVYNRCLAVNDEIEGIKNLFENPPFTPEREKVISETLKPLNDTLLRIGLILSKKLGYITNEDLVNINWSLPKVLPTPVINGLVRIEPANESFKAITRETTSVVKPLEKILTLESGNVKRTLVCSNDPLESFGADLSVFENSFKVSVRAWPDDNGRLFVEEASPILNLPNYNASDFVQGRLFDDKETGEIVIRINANFLISIDDKALQNELRAFIGTAVVLYGKRVVNRDSGKIKIENVYKDYWILCRLTDPKDEANNLQQAPLPSIQKEGCLCIGGTPPWNWQGPNIRTHILTPIYSIGLMRNTERRVVFGHILQSLPDWIHNTYPEIKRILSVNYITERDTDNEVHWATRLGPIGTLYKDLSGITHLTSAIEIVS